MKKLLLCLIIILSAKSYVDAQCASSANVYSFNFGQHTYEVIKELKSFSDAASCAVQRGGYLASIDSMAEQTAVYNGIVAAGIAANYHPVTDGGGASYLWLGASDSVLEGSWIWDGDNNGSGSGFWSGQGSAGAGGGTIVNASFVNWGGAPNFKEPDNFGSNQDCGAMALSAWPNGANGEWNDIQCSNTLYYIVEYNQIQTGHPEIASQDFNFLFYPNPVEDELTLILSSETDVVISDLTGKELSRYRFEPGTSGVTLSHITKGIYLIRFTDMQGNMHTEKMIKQ